MPANNVVNNLIRAAASVSSDISDAELDAHVAKLLAAEAKANDAKWSELGLGAFLGSGSGSRDSPDPSLPKPNKRFLASVIRNVDGHNTALLRQQAESARDARRAREPVASSSSRRATPGSAAGRLFGGALRSVGQDSSRRGERGPKERERDDGRGKERDDRRRDEVDERRRPRDDDRPVRRDDDRRRDRDDRRSSRRDQSDDERRRRRHDDSEDDRRSSKRRSRRDSSDDERERRRDRRRDDDRRTRDLDRDERRSKDDRDRNERRSKDKRDRRRDDSSSPPRRRRHDSPSPPRRRRDRSNSPQRRSHRSPSATPPPPPPPADLSPPASPISRMDKYFKKSYDPALDVGDVPKTGPVTAVGWDNMLAVLKDRGKKRRKNSPRLSDSPEPGPKPRDEGSAWARQQRELARAKPADEKSIMEMEYTARGGVREWDQGK